MRPLRTVATLLHISSVLDVADRVQLILIMLSSSIYTYKDLLLLSSLLVNSTSWVGEMDEHEVI